MVEDRLTQRTVTVVMAVIALLAFVFSFGNVWALALRLGVPHPVAPLTAPMVDLSVIGLLVGLRLLSLSGVPQQELTAATRLMHLCGLLTLALNVAEPLVAGHYGRAAVDAVAPLLLLGWSQVGPQFLRHFHALSTPNPAETPVPLPAVEHLPDPLASLDPAADPVLVPPSEPALALAVVVAAEPEPAPVPAKKTASAALPAVPEALLTAARRIAETHHAEQGEHITPGQLKARLGVTLPLATAAHAQLSA
ncbi:SpdA protein [Streptomyces sp. NPDC087294]|uniref:SpdA protein n=1 Tax=Streptomyces sp. NPDC087294 TaxID=3365777 RepID=UPI00381A2D46